MTKIEVMDAIVPAAGIMSPEEGRPNGRMGLKPLLEISTNYRLLSRRVMGNDSVCLHSQYEQTRGVRFCICLKSSMSALAILRQLRMIPSALLADCRNTRQRRCSISFGKPRS